MCGENFANLSLIDLQRVGVLSRQIVWLDLKLTLSIQLDPICFVAWRQSESFGVKLGVIYTLCPINSHGILTGDTMEHCSKK